MYEYHKLFIQKFLEPLHIENITNEVKEYLETDFTCEWCEQRFTEKDLGSLGFTKGYSLKICEWCEEETK